MERLIYGKRYSTKSATIVAQSESEAGQSLPHYWRATLYRRRDGEFFLHGEGGPLSRFAANSKNGNRYASGENIILLTPEQAEEWQRLTNAGSV